VTFLLDTNVYFALLLDPKTGAERRAAIARAAPRTHLSSVVLAELLQGARGDLGRARLRRAVATLERTGRLVAPSHADWAAAAIAQGRIWDRAPHLRTKSVLHDALIASSARRIGATVVTTNVGDFDLIRPHIDHRAISLADLSTTY
jgi:predicted nucleic acid-binding protein